MNYIMEIRLFYDRLEIAPLPPTAIALWHGLMYLANRSGWPKEISIPVGTLEIRSGLERRSVYRARDVLRDGGLIDFRERAGNQCAMYRIIPMETLLYDSVAQSATENVTQDHPPEEPCDTDLSHIASHTNGLPGKSVTQDGTQMPDCCTGLSHSVSPLDKQIISVDNEKKEDNRGSGEKKKAVRMSRNKPAEAEGRRNQKQGFDLSFIGDPEWENLVRTWLDYKQSRNEGYKSHLSVKKFHTMLRNLSGSNPGVAGRIIDKSIARNWAGIFELTDDSPKAKGQPAGGQRIGQIKQPEDEERRRRLLEKFDKKKP